MIGHMTLLSVVSVSPSQTFGQASVNVSGQLDQGAAEQVEFVGGEVDCHGRCPVTRMPQDGK